MIALRKTTGIPLDHVLAGHAVYTRGAIGDMTHAGEEASWPTPLLK